MFADFFYHILHYSVEKKLSQRNISSNQLFSNLFSKTAIFTEFLPKLREREFPKFPHCVPIPHFGNFFILNNKLIITKWAFECHQKHHFLALRFCPQPLGCGWYFWCQPRAHTLEYQIIVVHHISAWWLTIFLLYYIKLQDFGHLWPIFLSK